MKKGIIGIIVLAIIAGGGYYAYSHMKSSNNKQSVTAQAENNNNNNTVTQNTSNSTNTNTSSNSKTTDSQSSKTNKVSSNSNTTIINSNKSFSKEDMSNYYKLSQNVGDIGLPSAAMTTNLDAYKTIDGVNYYSTYSYDTRAAYQNDTSTPQGGNHSHMVSSKIVSLNNQTISKSTFGIIDSSKMSATNIENQIYKIAAMYVEGYTANDPNLVVSANDNYEGNLNVIPEMQVNLNNTKEVGNEKLYEVIANLNGYSTPIYVGLDGYIYISSEQDFNQLFFPNRVN
ncbi:MAG: hypothetical protein ACRCTZ_18875 [Sarcina sp.]